MAVFNINTKINTHKDNACSSRARLSTEICLYPKNIVALKSCRFSIVITYIVMPKYAIRLWDTVMVHDS